MNTLYNTCWADPWLLVAKKLEAEKNLKPVYWIGYYDDNSENDVPENFKGITYHSRWDSWKGIFPGVVEKNYTKYALDIDFLKSISQYELQAISQMDRMDPDRHRFSFNERQRLFRNMLRKWFACIDLLKIDIIIADRIPHRSYDYPLYLIAKYLKIKYIFFIHTYFNARTLACTNLNGINPIVNKNYKAYKKKHSNTDQDFLQTIIKKDIWEKVALVRRAYTDAIPDYMIAHNKTQNSNSNILKLGANFLLSFLGFKPNTKIHRRRNNKGLFDDFFDIHPYSKKRNKPIEESAYNAIEYGFMAYKGIKYKKQLRRYYQRLAEKPDYKQPYVFFAPHYQPEATSNPSADIFVDQILAIEQLASNIPKGWFVYVKEHVSQFLTISEGQKARFKYFYDDLRKIDNVRLISLNVESFDLIDHAKAVATLTGTVGWEAVLRKKPVIIFGISWYEAFPGVLKIASSDDAKKIQAHIKDYEYNEKSVLNYLLTIQELAPLSYSYLAIGKEKITEDVCVNNIFSQISSALIFEIEQEFN